MRTKTNLVFWYVAIVVLFACLVILPAPDPATLVKYHLSSLGLRLIDITLVIPEAAIWFAAFYGSYKLRNYSRLIAASPEGTQIGKLARGLFLLAVGLPASAILGAILSLIAVHHPGFKAASVVISNYSAVLFPLLAFLSIMAGARGLGEAARTRPSLCVFNTTGLVAVGLGVGFCSLLAVGHQALRTAYHMPPALVMLTLAAPYTYIWLLGLFAVAELRAYSRKVRGIVYRKSWKLLIAGIAAIILLSIVLQYLSTLSSWLTSLSLQWVLLLLYVLLMLLTAAYIVVALGAHQLTKIEEV